MCGCDWRSGNDNCHDEMVDARPGVKYGCDDWWVGRYAAVTDNEVELREAVERVDREDMTARYKSWRISEI